MAKAMTVEELAAAVAQALGPRLVAFLLYGSAARGEAAQVPGRSDVNTLLICDTVDDGLFAALAPPLARWRKTGQPAPLIFSEREWRESADAFPIEYEDLREAHRVLAGRDPLAGIAVRREDLRRQLEHELKGKVIRLRQAAAALRGEPKVLAEALAGSRGGVLAMLRATLRLAGREVPPAPDACIAAAAGLVGFRADALDPSRAADYLDAVTRTAEFVNRL